MINPLVSVIIPTKNEEKNILRCLKSIKKQKNHETIEIILVDNYSSDQTVQLAKKYVSHVILSGPERSAQRNIGAKKAKGKWLLFVDADMELSPNAIDECIQLTEKRLVSPIIVINEKGVGSSFLGKALALEKNCYTQASWLRSARFFPRNFFLQLGGYDETLISGEDWDLTQRFREEGFPFYITPHAYVNHYESDEGLIPLLKKEVYYISHIHLYARKHPLAFSYQGSYLYRLFIWIRSWRQLLPHPFLTATFLSYKFSVWIIWQWYRRRLSFTAK